MSNMTIHDLPPGLAKKARKILNEISISNYRNYGKHIIRNKSLVACEVNRQYRLLFKIENQRLVFVGLFTHDEYQRIVMA